MPECRTEHRGRVERRRTRARSHWGAPPVDTTGRFPIIDRGWYGHASQIEQFLREVQILSSRGAICRLLEDVAGLLEVLGSIVQRIRDTRGAVPIRIRTTNDHPPQIAIEFPVSAPAEAIAVLDEFDRWLIRQSNRAHRRVIVDVFYQT